MKLRTLKPKIRTVFAQLLQTKLRQQTENLRETAAIVRDAPGSNVTRSDTSRFQYGNVHMGLQSLVAQTEACVAALKGAPETCSRIGNGALVEIEDESSNKSLYFILAEADASRAEVDGITVTTISTQSPLAQALVGKELDDEVEFREKTLTIIGVA